MSDVPGKGAGELVLYATADGSARIFLRAEGGTVWLTQLELADLFDTTKQNISLHTRNVLREGELNEQSVVKQRLTTALDGKRYQTQLYNLDMILAIGYRVRSPRGTQFRQWATTHLKEYLVKGFVMDDVRLKDPVGWDFFDELLERIRDIRASEKRFYQKVRDLFALSIDYRDDADAASVFFAEVQNKMLHFVTGHTAAEIVVQRADAAQPNMALTAWKGERVRKADVIVAKNYLGAEEVNHLNRIVVAFLEFAELRTLQRKTLRMADWRQYVDSFIRFNEGEVLQGAGQVGHEDMLKIAHERYEAFDGQRKRAAALKADAEDLKTLARIDLALGRKDPRNAS